MPERTPQQRGSSVDVYFAHEVEKCVTRSRSGRRIRPTQRLENDTCRNAGAKRARLNAFDSEDDELEEASHADSWAANKQAPRKTREISTISELQDGVPVQNYRETFLETITTAETEQSQGPEGGSSKGGGIFKTAAFRVLRQEMRLMNTGEITRVARKLGYINVQGRTPEATMASALYTDLKRKEGQSVFFRPHEGMFGLREWLDQGWYTDDKEVDISPKLETPEYQAASLDANFLPVQSKAGVSKRRPPRVRAARSYSVPVARESTPPAANMRQFSNNMDVLFAAVDQVSADSTKDPAAHPSSDSGGGTCGANSNSPAEIMSSAAAPTPPPAVPDAVKLESAVPLAIWAKPAVEVAAMHAGDQYREEFLQKVLAAARTEVMVKALENELGRDHKMLAQAYMHLCKLYNDAGALEKATSCLSRAMEINHPAA